MENALDRSRVAMQIWTLLETGSVETNMEVAEKKAAAARC